MKQVHRLPQTAGRCGSVLYSECIARFLLPRIYTVDPSSYCLVGNVQGNIELELKADPTHRRPKFAFYTPRSAQARPDCKLLPVYSCCKYIMKPLQTEIQSNSGKKHTNTRAGNTWSVSGGQGASVLHMGASLMIPFTIWFANLYLFSHVKSGPTLKIKTNGYNLCRAHLYSFKCSHMILFPIQVRAFT